jgi:hypothetical protein
MSGRSGSSKRNLLDKASAAQSLDADRLTGSLLIPSRKYRRVQGHCEQRSAFKSARRAKRTQCGDNRKCIGLDIGPVARHIPGVGLNCSRPAYSRHIAQALQPRYPSGGLLAICPISTSLSSGGGIGTRAFDDRPVSCRVQPSVVSLPMEMRNVLRSLDLQHPYL